MKQHTLAKLGALLALSSAWMGSAATAQVIGLPPLYAGPVYGGTSTFDLSGDFLAALDTMRMSMTGYDLGTTVVTRDTDGFYSQASMAAPALSVDMDSASMAVFATHATGGMTLTAPAIKSVSTGGVLTITDLSLDFGTKLISGTVIGANGVGTQKDIALWTADTISSSVKGCPGVGLCDAIGHPNVEFLLNGTATGLRLAEQGRAAFTQSLGMLTLGRLAIYDSPDFGTLTTQTYLIANDNLHAVPEPSTWTLMGMGLIGLLGATRRRA